MDFRHAPGLRADFPELAVALIHARNLHHPAEEEDAAKQETAAKEGIAAKEEAEDLKGGDAAGRVAAAIREWEDRARELLGTGTESELPQVQAWRRAFARLGVKPTQYRSAAEALLRRLRREGELPRVQVLVDLCNAVSAAYGVPVAALDLAHVKGDLIVDRAVGNEVYRTFAGGDEHPAPGEVIFRDDAGNAHARRWTNRQSGLSAVTDATTEVLIVSEALHPGGAADVDAIATALTSALTDLWDAEIVSTST